MGIDSETRGRNVTAVLGPTNTGKTHLAIERMLGHETGMIGLPLRLLAREVYDKIAARTGPDQVALITGEEKIRPEHPRYWVSTVEAMPRDIEVDFLAIDEVQLAADPERGHVFTDRLLHERGRFETLLLGAGTMREAIADLVRGAHFISRPRLSKLTYAGQKKITRLPARTAVVAFSADDVYQIAELIRRQRGGAAVVLGALSPRTRNAQVALYQSGDVDFLVATDAIGMGLNLDINHVAFAGTRKFDGQHHRQLTPAELAQISGRAGRHMNDGTFGVTGDVAPFEQDVVERLETHVFDTVKTLQWRARTLDFSSLDALRDSLRQLPREPRLARARMADDVTALEHVSADREVVALAVGPAAVATLWEVCQIPDYRNISAQNHAELVATLYKFLLGPEGKIPEDWFARQVAFADRTDGDIDTLANRIAHIRTWTFVSNRPDWLTDPSHWQGRTRAIEDRLSDALHERLALRFVDRRTSALMKRLRDKEALAADISDDGAIHVESHYVGRLKGFCFSPDGQAEGIHGKATRHAAAQVLAKELSMRARRVAAAKPDAFRLSRRGRILWRDEEIARLEPGDKGLSPQVIIIADEHLQPADREKVQTRLDSWLTELIGERLKPLVDIAAAEDVTGLARGIAFRLSECFGALKREAVAHEMRSLDQAARAQLRKYGVRFGAFNIYFPPLLKPAAAELIVVLWSLKHASAYGLSLDALPELPRPGLTSFAVDPKAPEPFYRAYGFHVCGPRAIRIDILERLADLIRTLLAWRPSEAAATPPKGSTGDGGFTVTPEMMSILGCSAEEVGHVLRTLGFACERRPLPSAAAPTPPPAAAQPAARPAEAVREPEGGTVAPLAPAAPEMSEAPPADLASPAPTDPLPSHQSAGAPGPEPQPAAVASPEGDTPEQANAAAPEPAFVEIWRPRRRREHRRDENRRRFGRRDGSARPADEQAEGRALADGSAGRRPKQRPRGKNATGRSPRREQPQPAQARTTSSPTQKRGAIDPDSPFAALGALKIALEKRAQDPSTS